MRTLIDLLTALLPLLYGLAAVNYLVYYLRRDTFAEKTCTPFLLAVFVLDCAFLLLRFVHFQRYPIASLAEVLSVIAMAVTGVYLYVERIQKNKATGVFIVGLVVLVQLLASGLLPHMQPADSALLEIPWLAVHIMAAVLAYSGFAVGAAYGLMFLLLYRVLKRKRFGLMFERLPSLDVTANMGAWANLLGWILLSAAMLLGIFMSFEHFPLFYRDAKFISTAVVWLVYAGALGLYFLIGWRGARSAWLSLLGFVFTVLATASSQTVWSSFHAFSR